MLLCGCMLVPLTVSPADHQSPKAGKWTLQHRKKVPFLIPEGQELALSACSVEVIIRDPCMAGGNHYIDQELQCAKKLAVKLVEILSLPKNNNNDNYHNLVKSFFLPSDFFFFF